jgi:hypothetical protein
MSNVHLKQLSKQEHPVRDVCVIREIYSICVPTKAYSDMTLNGQGQKIAKILNKQGKDFCLSL